MDVMLSHTILWAEKVCKVYLESTKIGKGATTVDGKMIDEVHYKQAKTLLAIYISNKSIATGFIAA